VGEAKLTPGKGGLGIGSLTLEEHAMKTIDWMYHRNG
jgi:hypothetical protein